MKIVLFNPLRDTRVRGISRYASELARDLRARGHEVHELAFPRWFARLPRAVEVPLFVLAEQLWAPAVALRRRARLVIDPYNAYSLLGAALLPTVCVYHDFIAIETRRWALRPSALYQRALHLAARGLPRLRVCCISAPVLRAARRYVPGKEPALLPNVVSRLADDGAPGGPGDALVEECRRRSAEGALTVSTISGEGWNKEFGALTRALAALPRPAHLVAFGFREGGEGGPGADGARLSVRRVGPVPGAVIARVLGATDAFVFHSVAEGYGRPVVEALLEGKVAITARVPALETLSEEALENVIVYDSLAELPRCLEAARGRTFRPFARLEARSAGDVLAEVLAG
jgi:glycosyltransferase involved in cell wall biosynthesis